MSKARPKRLGDILNFKRGYDLPSHKRVDGIYPVISSSGISGFHDEYMVSGQGVITGQYGTLGQAYFVDGDYWPHNTALYVTDFKGNHPKYVYYLMKCLGNLKTSDKSTVPGVNRNDLHEISVPYINPDYQEPIADVLSTLDAKIELNNRINAELEAMAKTLYNYWFVQFDFPYDFEKGKLDPNGKPYKSSGGKMVYNKTLKREIPVGWEVDTLGQYLSSNRGVSYSLKNIGDKGVPMVNLASFNVDGSYKHNGLKFFNGEYSNVKIIKPFDLVMCNTQQTAIDYSKDIIGKAFLVPDVFSGDVVSSHHVTRIKVQSEPLKYFLHRLFNTDYFHRYIAGYASGTNILGLIFSGVENYVTEIPAGDLLNVFARLMGSIEKQKSVVIQENQQLAQLRDWLLPMLMNGQVGFTATKRDRYNESA